MILCKRRSLFPNLGCAFSCSRNCSLRACSVRFVSFSSRIGTSFSWNGLEQNSWTYLSAIMKSALIWLSSLLLHYNQNSVFLWLNLVNLHSLLRTRFGVSWTSYSARETKEAKGSAIILWTSFSTAETKEGGFSYNSSIQGKMSASCLWEHALNTPSLMKLELTTIQH